MICATTDVTALSDEQLTRQWHAGGQTDVGRSNLYLEMRSRGLATPETRHDQRAFVAWQRRYGVR